MGTLPANSIHVRQTIKKNFFWRIGHTGFSRETKSEIWNTVRKLRRRFQKGTFRIFHEMIRSCDSCEEKDSWQSITRLSQKKKKNMGYFVVFSRCLSMTNTCPIATALEPGVRDRQKMRDCENCEFASQVVGRVGDSPGNSSVTNITIRHQSVCFLFFFSLAHIWNTQSAILVLKCCLLIEIVL